MPFNIKPPMDDDEYFERMCRAIFQGGLNWQMIEKKWPNFRKAFDNFSIEKVAKYGEQDVKKLMNDAGIVRNEKKIRSAIYNAQEFQRIQKEFKSFPRYLGSFRNAEYAIQNDISERFKHIGPSSARMYLWMVGMKLTPNAEEKKWIAEHDKP